MKVFTVIMQHSAFLFAYECLSIN